MDISTYSDGLAARGRYHFTTVAAVAALGSAPIAVRAAIRRLREKARVVECFARHLEHDRLRVSRAALEMNLHEKLSDETFLSDVEPLIAPDTAWSFEDAAGYVQRTILPLPLLPGAPWRDVLPRRWANTKKGARRRAGGERDDRDGG